MAETAAEYAAKQREVWNTYVATTDININGVRAFNTGDPVPSTHVDSGAVDAEQVAKTTTKSGREAIAATVPTEPKG